MLKAFIARLAGFADLSLVAVRVMMGIILVWHGYGKVTHGFAIGFFRDKLGFPVAEVIAPFITFLELLGGIALIVGLFTRYLGVLYVIEFIVAAYVQAFALGKGYPGAELELLLLFVAALLATHGGGTISVDHSVRHTDM
jgi:putative oxidoreductase